MVSHVLASISKKPRFTCAISKRVPVANSIRHRKLPPTFFWLTQPCAPLHATNTHCSPSISPCTCTDGPFFFSASKKHHGDVSNACVIVTSWQKAYTFTKIA
jgi:hypothetical protein